MVFDGQIVAWSSVKTITAPETRCSQPAGAMITTCLKVDGEVCLDFMPHKVVPANVEKYASS